MNKPGFQWPYRQVIPKKYHNSGMNHVLENTRKNQLCGEGNISTEPWRIDRILSREWQEYFSVMEMKVYNMF